jgi:hypothetical protein
MVVWYVHKSTAGGVTQAANILWKEKCPMRADEFPPEHPCVASAAAFTQFKARGYWANSFPEGDGITLDLKNDQSAEEVVKDIEECFGWQVRRGFPS